MSVWKIFEDNIGEIALGAALGLAVQPAIRAYYDLRSSFALSDPKLQNMTVPIMAVHYRPHPTAADTYIQEKEAIAEIDLKALLSEDANSALLKYISRAREQCEGCWDDECDDYRNKLLWNCLDEVLAEANQRIISRAIRAVKKNYNLRERVMNGVASSVRSQMSIVFNGVSERDKKITNPDYHLPDNRIIYPMLVADEDNEGHDEYRIYLVFPYQIVGSGLPEAGATIVTQNHDVIDVEEGKAEKNDRSFRSVRSQDTIQLMRELVDKIKAPNSGPMLRNRFAVKVY